mgnify:CR=1 FL=1
MKVTIVISVYMLFCQCLLWAQSIEETSYSLVEAQLQAYNARDIEAFLVPYSDSVKIYSFPNQFLYQGKEKMRDNYTYMFAAYPELHCELVGRLVQGNVVIDQEIVTRAKNAPLIEATAIYRIANNKIQEVYFIYKE